MIEVPVKEPLGTNDIQVSTDLPDTLDHLTLFLALSRLARSLLSSSTILSFSACSSPSRSTSSFSLFASLVHRAEAFRTSSDVGLNG